MGSLLRRVKERKKTRRLGEVEVMEQEGYGELEVDSKVEMIRALVPLGLMHVHGYCQVDVGRANLSRRADFLCSHRTAQVTSCQTMKARSRSSR